MKRSARFVVLLCALTRMSSAQLPFYTDNPSVTEPGQWHFEFFNEVDALQRPQYPALRQNTASYKLNYGLPHDLELDIDAPYLAIFRALGTPASTGIGDTNWGVKWNFHKESRDSRLPALGVSFYIEFPTGDTKQQLGSGLSDYWLNLMAQKSLSPTTRLTANAGYLFAGNTGVGELGIRSTRGHVYTAGFSILHDVTPRLTLGGEVYAGLTSKVELARSQLQVMIGGEYGLRRGLTLALGALGGKYVASPKVGGQIGFSLEFPDILYPAGTR